MREQEQRQEMRHKEQLAQIDAATKIHMQRIFSATEQAKVNQGLMQKEQQHSQQMRHQEESAKSQHKTNSANGKTTQSRKQ